MKNFNPRTHKGYDTIDRGVNVSIYHFNPRTREGYDYSLGTFLFCLYSFNPRIHKGYDKAHQKRKNKLSALIPIPTKGTMPRSFKRVFNYKCFNPRTHEGYDISIYLLTLLSSRFNPRTHEGYDHDFFTNEKLPFNSFNPRTREGYDNTSNLKYYRF